MAEVISSGSSIPVIEEPTSQLVINFSNLIKDPIDRKRFIESITRKPDRWSLRHKGPYYRAAFALQFRQVLDEMMENKKSRIYRYKDFSEMKPNSLYLKIIQSKGYLLDHLDHEGKYKLFCEALDIRRKRGIGVTIYICGDLLELDESPVFKPDYLTEGISKEEFTWRDSLQLYLESEDKTPFEVKGLILTEEEIQLLEVQLSQLDTIAYRISSDRVRIVKT